MAARRRKFEDYLIPETDTLRNLLGITGAEELSVAERKLSQARLVQMRMTGEPAGDYDLAHLKAVHKHVFQDLYEWAGEVRTHEQGVEGGSFFVRLKDIAREADALHRQLVERNYLSGRDRTGFIDGAADLLDGFNRLHPFREGNGRTQRAVVDQLAASCGWRFAWREGHAFRERNVEASIAAMGGDSTKLRELLDSILVPLSPA